MEVDNQALAVVDKIKAFKPIATVDEYLDAANLWKAGRDMMVEIDRAYDSIISAAHKAHKEAVAKKKSFYEPVEAATRKLKTLMAAWDVEQERKRKAEQERLEAEARVREWDRKLDEAIAAEGAGDRAAADAIMDEPVLIAPVLVPKLVPKTDVVFREVWKFRIVDVALVPRNMLIPDEVKIGQYVRAMKSASNIPGVEVYSEKV